MSNIEPIEKRGSVTFHVKPGRSVHIGEDVRVTVVQHAKGGLRLRFEAPRSVEVDRDVVRARKEREGRRKRYAEGDACPGCAEGTLRLTTSEHSGRTYFACTESGCTRTESVSGGTTSDLSTNTPPESAVVTPPDESVIFSPAPAGSRTTV